ncbi:MAG: hypothetical protein HOG49_41585 [Candidatus Scalindua sp.]|jgi:hypothetical protein|nr:hypothetical protein [Candidatus Scalindua sp.]
MRVKLTGSVPRELTEFTRKLKGEYQITFEKVTGKRTLPQNNSLHLFCDQLAQEFTDKHVDKRTFFKEPFYTRWSPLSIKEDIWKPVMYALFKKKSTTQLDKQGEIDEIWDVINKIVIEKEKGEVNVPPWPSQESMFEEYDRKKTP